MPHTHQLPDEQVHFAWDAGTEPVLSVDSGDTVVVWTRDVSDNQIGPDSDASVIAGLDWNRVYPLNGPVAINGAEPGDTLAIEILDIHTQGWGWTAVLPGLGLLPDDFPDAYLRTFDLARGDVAFIREDIAIPLEPFFGTMGVCPAGATAKPVMPPGRFGEIWTSASSCADPRCICRFRWNKRCSRAAMLTAHKATARFA